MAARTQPGQRVVVAALASCDAHVARCSHCALSTTTTTTSSLLAPEARAKPRRRPTAPHQGEEEFHSP
jgi:hypothetical protein